MSKIYDVCLLLEGTYPFVSGGVSSWLHRLITGIPELSFTAVCILPSSKENWEYKYATPPNFGDIKVIYLHDPANTSTSFFKPKRLPERQKLKDFHKQVIEKDFSLFEDIQNAFDEGSGMSPSFHELVHGKEAFNLLVELYEPEERTVSFLDYFWTYRFTHIPIFKALKTKLPKARVYHTISTGYAGLLGVLAKSRNKRPLLLTEHGIYVKERKIEIAQAEWIYMSTMESKRVQKDLGTFQMFWIKIFEALGRLTYNYSDKIFTLYEGNKEIEIREGADADRIEIIPNGIDIERFSALKPADYPFPHQQEFIIGFVGRVVPIKDVKTFIRACKIASMRLPNMKAYIMGPNEEDKTYFRECKELVKLLDIEDVIVFTGKVNVMEYYPKIDLLVLTSISEAQPLVILEANCAGIPCVASDVGSCRELLEGRTKEDRRLGPSGMVTGVADPAGTADAMINILSNFRTRASMSAAGRKRVGTFYRESDLNEKYKELYRYYMSQPDWDQ